MSLIPLSIFGLDYLKLLSIKSSLCILNTDLLLLYGLKVYSFSLWLVFPTSSQGGLQNFTLECWDSKYITCRKKKLIHGLCFWSQGDLIYLHYSSLLLCVQPYIPLIFPASNVFTVSIVQSSHMFCDKVALHLTKWIWLYMSLPY